MLQASAYIGADTSLDSATDPAANIILPGGTDSSSTAAAAAAGGSSGGSKGVSSGDAPVLPVVPFEACINKFAAAEVCGVPQCLLLLAGNAGTESDTTCLCVSCRIQNKVPAEGGVNEPPQHKMHSWTHQGPTFD